MEFYSPREIAYAAGVSIERVVAAVGSQDRLVRHDDAVRIGRWLATSRPEPFAIFGDPGSRRLSSLPLALSSTIHLGLLAAVVMIAAFGLAPRAETVVRAVEPGEDMRLVFLAIPGPGGGGGGGGARQTLPPPKALQRGNARVSSPLPVRHATSPQPVEVAPEPKVLDSEPLPVVAAPIVRAPADNRDRDGVLTQSRAEADSRGSGQGGGTGTGRGGGLGDGSGSGVGPGSGGGTGGGPFRPGSGVVAPRLIKEVKGDYTDAARRAGISGDVVLELVVRRDGTVGEVRVLEGLGGGLNERAINAVRQWRFAPATRLGVPVDVVVEVAMEFKLR